ncbi:NAD(P)-dependent oxidoreductase [Devosia sp.]|uniref:NAD(P)-dependent oxidoreductase n=1 Tax=Devosia sp. TaxID=1871048 RepID=UPI00352542B5
MEQCPISQCCLRLSGLFSFRVFNAEIGIGHWIRVPLTPETSEIVDKKLIDSIKDGALFINGARGGHVVDADLIAALDSGKLSGAALDVFRIEPLLAEGPLSTHPKIRLSPHVAAPTYQHMAVREMAANIRRFENGELVHHTVDRSLGYQQRRQPPAEFPLRSTIACLRMDGPDTFNSVQQPRYRAHPAHAQRGVSGGSG